MTAAQTARIITELERGPVARTAFTAYFKENKEGWFPIISEEALERMDKDEASNVIDALLQGHETLVTLAKEYGFCDPVYAQAWLKAKRDRIADIEAKNDLNKPIV